MDILVAIDKRTKRVFWKFVGDFKWRATKLIAESPKSYDVNALKEIVRAELVNSELVFYTVDSAD